MPKNRAIFISEFDVKMPFRIEQLKGAKGKIVRNDDPEYKEEYPHVFIPYAKQKFGGIEVCVSEKDLEFY